MTTATKTKYYAIDCSRCNGTGHISTFNNRDDGKCYRCNGSGDEIIPSWKLREPRSIDRVLCYADLLRLNKLTSRQVELINEASAHLKKVQADRILKLIPPSVDFREVLFALRQAGNVLEPTSTAQGRQTGHGKDGAR